MQRFYSCPLNAGESLRSESRHCCVLCDENVDDEFTLGVLFSTKYRMRPIAAHHHCLLFAAGLQQAGRDSQGFAGFLMNDIQNETERSKKLKCSYCKRRGAASGCGVRSCRQVYHYLCGTTHGCLFQFFGGFQSYCPRHWPHPLPCKTQEQPLDTVCPICMEKTKSQVGHNVLLSPCCGRACFHRNCIQRHAYAAGCHHFRCPLCNNADEFVKAMLNQGINIPDQDAAWEVEGLFDDLYQRYAHCDAETCACSKGRDHQEGRGPWRMILCSVCGQAGRHFHCLRELSAVQEWECEVCATVEERQTHPSIDTSLGQSSPESHVSAQTMEIYTNPDVHSSSSSCNSYNVSRFSSPIDPVSLSSYSNGSVTDDINQSNPASRQPSLEQFDQSEESIASVDGGKDESSIIFVCEIPAVATDRSRYSFPVDLQVETDSEPSDPEQSVYGWSIQQSLKQS